MRDCFEMDLLSFAGTKVFIDLSESAALIATVERNTHMRLNDLAFYEYIFGLISDLKRNQDNLDDYLYLEMFEQGVIDEDELGFLEIKDVELIHNACTRIARNLIAQLKGLGLYRNGILTCRYRGNLSSHTGIMFGKEPSR